MDVVELSEFLLARIAEDEEEARKLQAAYDRDELRVPAALVNADAIVVPNLVLKDCEAKRRIVEWCSERQRVWIGRLGDDPTDPANYVPGDYEHQEDAPVLRFLAMAYAWHPRFREEWHPRTSHPVT